VMQCVRAAAAAAASRGDHNWLDQLLYRLCTAAGLLDDGEWHEDRLRAPPPRRSLRLHPPDAGRGCKTAATQGRSRWPR
jgi:hypothetical protein